ncbi:hypothetical protein [Cellulomonas sp.]|uniref:hypothetical protein n=1 Tax=Cellulomonas sp. TaxID=40001 RepID=UPI001AFDF3F1|nr:hypothetical protein [Cellulomonas sp.]MBO9556101.1 hypothetical protein [Cellulomonas sp.]
MQFSGGLPNHARLAEDVAALESLAEWLAHVQLDSKTDQELLERGTFALDRIAFSSGVLMRRLAELSEERGAVLDDENRAVVALARERGLLAALHQLVDEADERHGHRRGLVRTADLRLILPAVDQSRRPTDDA